MGKTRVIAETGAGQHGVATATACALFGLECTIYMGEIDTQRQALNVARMRMLGAEVVAVKSGSRTLKDAINEAFRDWVANVDRTHYLFGTVAGPAPLPGHGPRLPPRHRRRGPAADPGARRPAARRRRRLRRRRLQRHRPLPRLHPRRGRPPDRLRARRTRHRDRRARGHPDRRRARHPARLPLVRPPGRGGPDHRAVLDLGRPRLPGHRPRARLPQGQRPRRVPRRHRRRGDAGPAPALPHRGHHPGHRERARAGRRPGGRQGARARTG